MKTAELQLPLRQNCAVVEQVPPEAADENLAVCQNRCGVDSVVLPDDISGQGLSTASARVIG